MSGRWMLLSSCNARATLDPTGVRDSRPRRRPIFARPRMPCAGRLTRDRTGHIVVRASGAFRRRASVRPGAPGILTGTAGRPTSPKRLVTVRVTSGAEADLVDAVQE